MIQVVTFDDPISGGAGGAGGGGGGSYPDPANMIKKYFKADVEMAPVYPPGIIVGFEVVFYTGASPEQGQLAIPAFIPTESMDDINGVIGGILTFPFWMARGRTLTIRAAIRKVFPNQRRGEWIPISAPSTLTT